MSLLRFGDWMLSKGLVFNILVLFAVRVVRLECKEMDRLFKRGKFVLLCDRMD